MLWGALQCSPTFGVWGGNIEHCLEPVLLSILQREGLRAAPQDDVRLHYTQATQYARVARYLTTS